MLTRCSCPGNFVESIELPVQTDDAVGAYWYVSAKERSPLNGWKSKRPAAADGVAVYKCADGRWSTDRLFHFVGEEPLVNETGPEGDKFLRGDYATLRELVELADPSWYEDMRPLLAHLVNIGEFSSSEFGHFEHQFFKRIQQDEVPLEDKEVTS